MNVILWLLLLFVTHFTGIHPDVDPLRIENGGPPLAWVDPGPDLPLDERLPYAWPEKYVKNGQAFNPWTFLQNAAALCDHPDIAALLIDRLVEFTEVDGTSRFVVTTFDYDFEGNLLEGPWRSAFSNGVVMSGLVVLSDCGHPEALVLASELGRGLYQLRTILEDGTVWYEEYPLVGLPGDQQPHVLNGHIYAVLGLYYLWDATGDWGTLIQMKAGIDAVANHGWEYRRPGEINLYDLRAPDTPDYGPARTIAQQDMLCLITRREVFRDLRDAFAEDMPEAAATVTPRCELDA